MPLVDAIKMLHVMNDIQCNVIPGLYQSKEDAILSASASAHDSIIIY